MSAAILPREGSVPTNKTIAALVDVSGDDDDDDGATAVTMLGADALRQPAGVAAELPNTMPTADAIPDDDTAALGHRRESRITRELELAVDGTEKNVDLAAQKDKLPTKEMEAASADAMVVESGDVHSDPAKDHHPPSIMMPGAAMRTRTKKRGRKVWFLVGALWLIATGLVAAIVFFPGLRERTAQAPPPPTEAPPKTIAQPAEPVTIRTRNEGATVRDAETGQALGRTPFTVAADQRGTVRRILVSREGARSVEVDLSTARGTLWVEIE